MDAQTPFPGLMDSMVSTIDKAQNFYRLFLPFVVPCNCKLLFLLWQIIKSQFLWVSSNVVLYLQKLSENSLICLKICENQLNTAVFSLDGCIAAVLIKVETFSSKMSSFLYQQKIIQQRIKETFIKVKVEIFFKKLLQ